MGAKSVREMYGRGSCSEPTDDEIRSIVRDTYARMLHSLRSAHSVRDASQSECFAMCESEEDASGKRREFTIADIVGKTMDWNPFLMNHRYTNILQEESAILKKIVSTYSQKHPEFFLKSLEEIRSVLDMPNYTGIVRRRHMQDHREGTERDPFER